MSDYTPAEIEEAVNDWEGWGELKWQKDGAKETLTLRGEVIEVEKIDDFGGEGQGDSIWVVIKVGDQLFRKDGYYLSHYGTDWDGEVTEVKPVERTVTFYE